MSMVTDPYWGPELLRLKRKIQYWQLVSKIFAFPKISHNISKYIAYSAFIVRKIAAEERILEGMVQQNQVIGRVRYGAHLSTIPTLLVEPNDANDTIIGKTAISSNEEINTICNKIVHDNDWDLWSSGPKQHVTGFLASSSKGGKYYIVSLNDWCNVLKNCASLY